LIDTGLTERLRRAETAEDVIRLAQEYLGSLAASDIALLPERCRPRSLHCAHDVSTYAFELLPHYGEETNASAKLVNQLAVFFTQATIRLSDILAERRSDDERSRRSA
jgi:hypothetical protein